MREAALIGGNGVTPVGAPMDGHDNEVTCPPDRLGLVDELGCAAFGQVGYEVDASPVWGRRPARRSAAGRHATRDNDDAGATRDRHERGLSRATLVTARADRAEARI